MGVTIRQPGKREKLDSGGQGRVRETAWGWGEEGSLLRNGMCAILSKLN